MTTTAVAALLDLGFTEIEARLFVELTQLGPSTGYRLSKAVGKAAANTYAALETLAQKGAVFVDEADGAKIWRAAPGPELIAALEARHAQKREQALAALATLKAPEAEPRLYALKTPDQVYARARAMIAAAKSILIFDLFPEPFSALEPDLARAAQAGVRVVGQIYGPVATPVETVTAPGGLRQAAVWPGQQVTLIADAREHMTALLSRDGERCRQAVWSDSIYLACVQHSGLAAELVLVAQQTGQTLSFDPSLFASGAPGLGDLTAPSFGD